MTDITRVVTGTVSSTATTVSRQGFGVLLGVHQVAVGTQAERYKVYSSISEIIAAGFATTDRVYEWASAAFAQSPSPRQIAVGRRIPGVSEVQNLSIDTYADGTWSLEIDDGDSARTYEYEASGETEIDVAEGFRALINADEGAVVTVPTTAIVVDDFDLTALIAGTTVTLTMTEPGAGASTVSSVTANTPPEAIATTLNAIEAETDQFYVFTIDARSDADITAAAAWAGARPYTKLFVAQTDDPDMATNTTPNIGTVLNGLSYDNVVLMWKSADAHHADAAMAAVGAAADLDAENGAITWALKTLVGVPVDSLTAAQATNIAGDPLAETVGNYGNIYVQIAGVNVTQEGKAVSGEFVDNQTTDAWVLARSQEAIFRTIVAQPGKLPFNNRGRALLGGALSGVLQSGVANGHFSGDDPLYPRVIVPESATTADRTGRIFRNLRGEAIRAGAIHKVVYAINVEV